MGIVERRLADREQLKQKIFNATSEILIEKGYEGLSIRKIAEKIQYSPGVIYNYFKDKNDIIRLIIDENEQRICTSMMGLGLDKMAPVEALRKGLCKYIWLMLENPQHYKAIILSGLGQSRLDEIAAGTDSKMDELNELLISVLAAGKNEGKFQIVNEHITALLLKSACTGLVNTLILSIIEGEDKASHLIEGYVDLLLRGVCSRDVN